jgi:ABC-type antimicrobial peptide transport system permease subunit
LLIVERNLISMERCFAQMAAFLGAVALALSCVGLCGLMSYAVQRRTNEIGVRMALGALPRWIAWMILRESLLLVSLGVVLGVGAAAGTTRWIGHLLYGLSPADPTSYAGAAVLLVVVAAGACLWPARRAAKIDPMVALRAE